MLTPNKEAITCSGNFSEIGLYSKQSIDYYEKWIEKWKSIPFAEKAFIGLQVQQVQQRQRSRKQ